MSAPRTVDVSERGSPEFLQTSDVERCSSLLYAYSFVGEKLGVPKNARNSHSVGRSIPPPTRFRLRQVYGTKGSTANPLNQGSRCEGIWSASCGRRPHVHTTRWCGGFRMFEEFPSTNIFLRCGYRRRLPCVMCCVI